MITTTTMKTMKTILTVRNNVHQKNVDHGDEKSDNIYDKDNVDGDNKNDDDDSDK